MPVSDPAPAPRELRTSGSDHPLPLHKAPELTMLGNFRLLVRGRDTELPAAAQRLVALLALRGRTSRSRAAGTLWPETTEHRALASLRTAIWRVNQAAPGLVSCPGGGVDLDAAVGVDVRRLVHVGLVALSVEDERPDGVENAVRCADAERVALPLARLGINLIESDSELLPDWQEEWLLADRQRLRQLRLHLLEVVAEQLSESKKFGLALEVALAALRADDLRESAHRAVIKIHIAEGNLVEARRAYGLCRDLLIDGLGIEPSAMTADLMESQADAGAGPECGIVWGSADSACVGRGLGTGAVHLA